LPIAHCPLPDSIEKSIGNSIVFSICPSYKPNHYFMKRRQLIQNASLLLGASVIPLGLNAWAVRSEAQTKSTKRLIVIFLRGAADGLNIVVPHQEDTYYDYRPSIAVPYPQETEGAIDLDGFFGLNPALSELMPLWEQRTLAFVHATGSSNDTRSHFDAQDYMENGTPGVKSTDTGWMNRLLANLPKDKPTQAVSVGTDIPRILEGTMPVAILARGKESTQRLSVDIPAIDSAFDRLYNGSDDLSQAYREGIQARKIILSDLKKDMMESAGDAPTTENFSQDARRLAQLMVGDSKTQLAFMDLSGWDTHVNQKTNLTNGLKPLAAGLMTLTKELGSLYKDTTIVVMSEFGRTVKENGNNGTDHGHGNVMWLLGGSLKGGEVYGKWPGLDESQLYEKRDLAVTTDFREVLGAVMQQHLQIPADKLNAILPDYKFTNSLNLIA
jgi:uncharacterized protein (DUF1501 family)